MSCKCLSRRSFSLTVQVAFTVSVIIAMFVAAWPVAAQGIVAVPAGPTDANDLEAFFDKTVPLVMEERFLPGAVIVVVKDGKVFFAKGYGYADLALKKPVDAAKTLFRVASVSKVFTATAVMQLVDEGKVRLDEDVNHYLKRFQLDANFAQPVTVAHLLTHSGGLDHRTIDEFHLGQGESLPLGEFLAGHLPARVRPPGLVISYSNDGMGLAGYLVEVVSGLPFEQYMDEHILRPLGMERSSFLIPAHLQADLAEGYEPADNGAPVPFYRNNILPAGGLSTTGLDMARFMIAHLQDGRYENGRILSETAARDMHCPHLENHPRFPGYAYGFCNGCDVRLRSRTVGGQPVLSHGGYVPGFGSSLNLFPNQKLGLFVAGNGGSAALIALRFLDRYFPDPAHANRPPKTRGQSDDLAQFAGNYRETHMPQRTFQKIASLHHQLRVIVGNDDTLTLGRTGWRASSSVQTFAEVEPLLFEDVNQPRPYNVIAFRRDDRGAIAYLCDGLQSYEKIPWHETFGVQASLLGLCGLIFLSVWIGWPAVRVARWWRKRSLPPEGRGAACVAYLLSALALGFWIAIVPISRYEAYWGMPWYLAALLSVPFMITGLAGGLVFFAASVWRKRQWTLWGRLHYTLVSLAALVQTGLLLYWNLLGVRY